MSFRLWTRALRIRIKSCTGDQYSSGGEAPKARESEVMEVTGVSGVAGSFWRLGEVPSASSGQSRWAQASETSVTSMTPVTPDPPLIPILRQQPIQRRPADAENLGRAHPVSSHLLEHFASMPPVHFLQRQHRFFPRRRFAGLH